MGMIDGFVNMILIIVMCGIVLIPLRAMLTPIVGTFSDSAAQLLVYMIPLAVLVGAGIRIVNFFTRDVR